MDCKTCNISDINCYEQCRMQEQEHEHDCHGCFGASMNDCCSCKYHGKEKVKEND